MMGLVHETGNLEPMETCSPGAGESVASGGIVDWDGLTTQKISDASFFFAGNNAIPVL